MTVSIYRALSPSGKSYIGITSKTADERWRQHVSAAAAGVDYPLLRAIRHHGDTSFAREVLMEAPSWEVACILEVALIHGFGTRPPFGYNATSGGDGTVGFVATPATRARMSVAAKIRASTPEFREAARLRAWRMHTPEARAKNSLSNRGRKASDETKAYMSRILTGRVFSDESRARMSASAKAKPPSTAETRARSSAALVVRHAARKAAETPEILEMQAAKRKEKAAAKQAAILADPVLHAAQVAAQLAKAEILRKRGVEYTAAYRARKRAAAAAAAA